MCRSYSCLNNLPLARTVTVKLADCKNYIFLYNAGGISTVTGNCPELNSDKWYFSVNSVRYCCCFFFVAKKKLITGYII